jgi:glycosyltransferase involved in cell wall biosynthesis
MGIPKISIIIPTFNSEKTIERALLSVLKQTYGNVECLVIDGFSKDKTIDIVKKFGGKIVFVSEKDNGIYHAMNKGIELSSGEWLLFLGSDDELEFNGIDKLIAVAEDADIVYGSTTIVYDSGQTKKRYCTDSKIIPVHSAAIHQSVIMRKSVMQNLNGFDEQYKLLADYDITLRAYLKGYRFKQINDFISRFSNTGISSYNFKGPKERMNIHIANNSMKFPRLYFIKDIIHLFLAQIKNIFLEKMNWL